MSLLARELWKSVSMWPSYGRQYGSTSSIHSGQLTGVFLIHRVAGRCDYAAHGRTGSERERERERERESVEDVIAYCRHVRPSSALMMMLMIVMMMTSVMRNKHADIGALYVTHVSWITLTSNTTTPFYRGYFLLRIPCYVLLPG